MHGALDQPSISNPGGVHTHDHDHNLDHNFLPVHIHGCIRVPVPRAGSNQRS